MELPGIPERLLLGPGPSNVSEAVRQAMARPTLGHLDPAFLEILDDVQEMLRRVFRANHPLTLPISGTGSAGMEACLVNLLEPGDRALVGVQGVFGERMASIVERIGAQPIRIEAEMGRIIPDSQWLDAIQQHRPDLVALVHAETSTGVAQPVRAAARAAREIGALTVLDCVTSLSGMPVEIEAWDVDAAYSGTQKCLSCPPGLSPITLGERAQARIERRRTPVQSWYLDLGLIGRYFGSERVYHHTAPVHAVYGLHEALRRVLEEGLEARFERHREAQRALFAGLVELGFEMWVAEPHRLPMLNAVVPPFKDEAAVRGRLLAEHGIEVGAGLGKLAGKIWRIGLMGENARLEVVDRLLSALRGF
ncbi:MAG: alanine--glyoxylate aminotransferase family protein [Myxococcales bacterium]|nr:alanine--glyoxylate aminotransferase family protein [Myxococcales bacterium]